MTESEFWEQLRSRINMIGSLAALGYCDWLEPKRYVLGASSAHVKGIAGFVSPTHKTGFQLALPAETVSLSEIDWEVLLPSKESSEWITINGGSLIINTLTTWQSPEAA